MNLTFRGRTWHIPDPTVVELNFERLDSLTSLLVEYRRSFKAAEEQFHAATTDAARDQAEEIMLVQLANANRMFQAIIRRVERWVRTTPLASEIPPNSEKDGWLMDLYQQIRETAIPAEVVKN